MVNNAQYDETKEFIKKVINQHSGDISLGRLNNILAENGFSTINLIMLEKMGLKVKSIY